jgi:hypothetical protein
MNQSEIAKLMLDKITEGATAEQAASDALAALKHADKINAEWIKVCVAATHLAEALAHFDNATAAYGKAKRS